MRFLAIIENTIHEGIAKKTVITLLVLVTLIIGFFLLALGATQDALFLFGKEIDEIPEEAIRSVEAVVVGFFYQVAIFVGVFSIASFYPAMQEQGTIDLLLSRPMSRINIYLAKFIGCMLIIFGLIVYLIGGTWLAIYLKTGIVYPEYLFTIPIFMLNFFSFMSFAALMGIVSRRTSTAALAAIVFPFIGSAIFYSFHETEILSGSKFWYGIFEGLYNIFPKTIELINWNINLVAKGSGIEGDLGFAIWSTLAFSIACYVMGSLIFQKRSY